MMSSNIKNELNYYFKKMSYFKKHSFDVWVTIIIIILFTILSSYFYILIKLKSLRSKWNDGDETIRCNPRYIVFADIISDGKDTPFDILSECTLNNVANIATTSFSPFGEHFSILNVIFSILYSIVLSIKYFFIIIYKILLSVVKLIQDIIKHIWFEIYYVLIIFNDTIQKILLSGNIIYYILIELTNLIKIVLIKFSRGIMTCVLGPLLRFNAWFNTLKVIIFTLSMISFMTLNPIGFIIGSALLVIFATMCEPSEKLNKISINAWIKFLKFNATIDNFGSGISTIPPNLNKPQKFAEKVANFDIQDMIDVEKPINDCDYYEGIMNDIDNPKTILSTETSNETTNDILREAKYNSERII